MEIVAQVEINPFCQKVLKSHWPDAILFDDVKSLDEKKLGKLQPIDLICGGFPCQPVSCAGFRRGDEDERWLWDEFYRIICIVKPRWVLVENVPGLLSIKNGRLFGGILYSMADIGYTVEWEMLSAAQFGAPHLRKRLFIVANANGYILWRPEIIEQKLEELRKIRSTWDLPRRDTIEEWEAVKHIPSMFCGVDDGIPSRLDRLKSLGNAVVPQLAYFIGSCIMDVDTYSQP